MKNYRKLAPGEVIREGDGSFVRWGFEPVAAQHIGAVNACYNIKIWRKARTEGCPPRWRWADAGEHCMNWIDPASGEIMADDKPWASDFDNTVRVMPYPEDPRLEDFWDTNCGICSQLIDECECAKRGLR